ncbi:hypothetical protein BGZ46_010508 [Entomortierella lignicola]|nr:hypothetical protein BGZ46_010508 [Entomortierella lignicola]
MIGLVSNNSPSLGVPMEALKIALPIGIGLASAAYLTLKAYSTDKSIPTAPLRKGDSTHETEYREDPDAFLIKCEEECGPVFNMHFLNKPLTVVSGPQIRDVFMNEGFSFDDAIEELTGIRVFLNSIKKSNTDLNNRTIHNIVRDNLTPNLPLFTPRIVEQLEKNLDKELGISPKQGGKFVEKPGSVLQEMVAAAMATVFVGPEISKSRKVIDTFITATADFGKVLGNGKRKFSFWRSLTNRASNTLSNPLTPHVQVLTEACVPVILERRRLEAEASEKGEEWDRPDDILQKLLDNFDKYNFVDLEDVCAHILILILASVHTTTDTSTNLLYYLAAYPEYMEKLYEEQQEVLDSIQGEREKERQELTKKGEPIGEDLDPAHDRDLSVAAVKRLAHMDSFVREVFRFRTQRLDLVHRARKDVTLSNGMVISKGSSVIVNFRSAHQGPEQGEDVTEFRPWRFVGKVKAASKAGSDYLPFGMGKHACPGRFLAIQELKTIGVLMVSKYSKIEIKDPSKTKSILLSSIGTPIDTGLTFTSRD